MGSRLPALVRALPGSSESGFGAGPGLGSGGIRALDPVLCVISWFQVLSGTGQEPGQGFQGPEDPLGWGFRVLGWALRWFGGY